MYSLHISQKLPIDLEKAWDFFSSPANLALITPPRLALNIKTFQHDKEMYSGQIITYTVKPLWNLELEWVTEIVAVQKPVYFIDEQRFGPYSFWHHEHWFTSIPGGVLMEDILHYKLPLGVLGKALHRIKVKNELDYIFSYRKEVLEKLFGAF